MSELFKSEMPQNPGWYWIKSRASGAESLHMFDLPQTQYWAGQFLERWLVGPRVPGPEQCAACAESQSEFETEDRTQDAVTFRDALNLATDNVALMPSWKQGILDDSFSPTMRVPREVVDNAD